MECPVIFKELQWWEERDVKDMPVYLKSKTSHSVYRAVKYNGLDVDVAHQIFSINLTDLLPATQKEYCNYIHLLINNKHEQRKRKKEKKRDGNRIIKY